MKKNILQKLLASAFCALLVLPLAVGPMAHATPGNCMFNENGDMVCDGNAGTQTQGSTTALPSLQSNPEYQQQRQNNYTGTGTIYMPNNAGCSKNDNPVVKATSAKMKDGVVTIKGSSNYQKGMTIIVSGATPAAYNGTFVITDVDSSGFSYKINPEPAQQPSGNITVKRDTSAEQQNCIDDMQNQLDQLENQINDLQSILSTSGSDINQMMENMTPIQQQNFMNALQQALQQMFGNPNSSLVGTNPLDPSNASPVRQAINSALQSAGVNTNANSNSLPTSQNTPASASDECNPATLQNNEIGSKDSTTGLNTFNTGTDNGTGANKACGAGWGQPWSDAAKCIADKDNASGGQCAKGVSNILQALGMVPQGTRNATASEWEDTLNKLPGWKLLNGVGTTACPPGGVMVFRADGETGATKNKGARCNSKGGSGSTGHDCGHIEVVTTIGGKRQYVSDKPRDNAGGSVPKNYAGCWVYDGSKNPTGKSDQINLPQCVAGLKQ